MAAITKSWTDIPDAALDPDAPLLSSLMYAIRDNMIHTREWLGASFIAGAAQDHNHDGINSAAIEVGPNLLRNGSFESGTAGWDITQYTGGTVAISTSQFVHGKQALAITSTSTANGGGDALTAAYIDVAPGERYPWACWVWASVANVSSRMQAHWYDSSKALISSTDVFAHSATPTTATLLAGGLVAPTNARYVRLRCVGGVPGVGSATGTIYFDGVKLGDFAQVGALGRVQVFTASATWSKPAGLKALRVKVQAGGGGAASASNTTGGGGGYAERFFDAASLPTSVTVTVGGGGAGGGSSGGNGGASSFGALISATGGGAAVSSGNGAGGTASGGGVNIRGGWGMSGYGGASVMACPGVGVGNGYGGGGAAGTAGSAGVVIIEEFF